MQKVKAILVWAENFESFPTFFRGLNAEGDGVSLLVSESRIGKKVLEILGH